MNYWDSVGRWINTLLVFIVGVLAFDALFRLLEANDANIIVSSVRLLSTVFLVPFRGMFGEQDFVLTTLVGVLGYALLAGIALGVLRSVQATRARPAPPVHEEPAPATGGDTRQLDARRPQAPAAPASPPKAAAAERPASSSSAKAPAGSKQRGDRKPERRRPSSAATSATAREPRREQKDGERRSNGRQRRARSQADAQESTRTGDKAKDRTGKRSASRGANSDRGT